MGSISYCIMPLIINSGDTDMRLHTHMHTDVHTETILRNQGCASHLVHTWFTKITYTITTIMLDQYFLIKESLMLL